MRRTLLLFWIFCLSLSANSQIVTSNKAFNVGEEFVLDAYFNVGFLWFKVGTASFAVTEERGNYLFTVKANNYPKWDWVYKMNTLHVASCTKDMQPLYMWCQVHEKGNYYEDRYDYTREDDHYWVRRQTSGYRYPDGRDTSFVMPLEAHDIINSVYAARNADLTVNDGVLIPFSPIFGDRVHTMYGSILGKQKVKTKEGETYDCLKCTAIVGSGTIVDDSDPVYVYVTDDDRKIPVLVETKLNFGKVKVYLKSYRSGLEDESGEK